MVFNEIYIMVIFQVFGDSMGFAGILWDFILEILNGV
jgi:hypothetical protein